MEKAYRQHFDHIYGIHYLLGPDNYQVDVDYPGDDLLLAKAVEKLNEQHTEIEKLKRENLKLSASEEGLNNLIKLTDFLLLDIADAATGKKFVCREFDKLPAMVAALKERCERLEHNLSDEQITSGLTAAIADTWCPEATVEEIIGAWSDDMVSAFRRGAGL